LTARPVPFLVGFERSGTTLLRAIVDAHPLVGVPPEAYFLVELAARRDLYERPGGVAVDRLAGDLAAQPRLLDWAMDERDVRAALTAAEPADYPDAMRALHAAWARREGKPWWGDKTPGNIRHLDWLAAMFPEARFVHILRDGRDAAASYAEEFGLALPLAIRRWRHRVRMGRAAGEALGPARYRELRYEALVGDPEPTIRELCDFLELTFDPAMLRHQERAEHLLAPLRGRVHHETVALPITPGLRDWRSQLAADDVALCEVEAGDLLAELGYELAGLRPSWRARAHRVRLDTGVRLRRVRRLVPIALRRTFSRSGA
jgi:Sulfotransferase family